MASRSESGGDSGISRTSLPATHEYQNEYYTQKEERTSHIANARAPEYPNQLGRRTPIVTDGDDIAQ